MARLATGSFEPYKDLRVVIALFAENIGGWAATDVLQTVKAVEWRRYQSAFRRGHNVELCRLVSLQLHEY